MTTELSSTFREIRDALEPLRDRSESARGALDLLDRDLLPRSAGGDTYAVVGIVGPNNAGKSALFNSLVGRDFSPSMPTGGATRRLVGALHPDLLAALRAEPTLGRFRLREVDGERADLATERTEDPAEVLVATDASLPPHVMLIDTPDFDSILDDNRLASESLLAVADLVVAVVTRHSYQNRAVVDFLETWFAHGRPWLLVYNEAIDRETAETHSAKLAGDVGTPPLGRFWSAHDLAVQRGESKLIPSALDGSGRTLSDVLFDLNAVTEVKARAFDAARARLREALERTTTSLVAEAGNARAILEAADDMSRKAALRVASSAMPAGPFVEAFRNVLDRRTNFLSRGWRTSLRQIRLGIESLPALWRDSGPAETEGVRLDKIEHTALREAWPTYWEELVRDLGPEARHPARSSASKAVATTLDEDLAGNGRSRAAHERVAALIESEPASEIGEFREECERLVENALDERGFDIDIQTAADVATLVPIALAAAVIVNTGGLGSDVAAAGSGALSTFLVEKYYHLLGRGVMVEAQRRWTELRGEQLATMILESTLPETTLALRRAIEEDDELTRRLEALQSRLAARDPALTRSTPRSPKMT